MIQPALVNGLTLRDLTFRASPNWSVHPLLCRDVLATNITIESGQFDGDGCGKALSFLRFSCRLTKTGAESQ